MKITSNGLTMDVSNAVQSTIRSSVDYYSRESEAVAEKVEKQSEIIGRLVEIMVAKNMLTADELSSLLSYNFKIEDEVSGLPI